MGAGLLDGEDVLGPIDLLDAFQFRPERFVPGRGNGDAFHSDSFTAKKV